jgi:hypothetical protein
MSNLRSFFEHLISGIEEAGLSRPPRTCLFILLFVIGYF